tara:strand:+ start:609 stop:824 length:216 start_codon:yes stop_codon:yes gene_type:complete
MLDNYRHTSYNINITIKVSTMSHAVNDEIIENIYEELVEEFGSNTHATPLHTWTDNQIEDEIIMRFEARSM